MLIRVTPSWTALSLVFVPALFGALGCSGETAAQPNESCQTCEQDQDCAERGAELRCRESGITKRCTVNCAVTPCPAGFECNLGIGGSGQDGGVFGTCSPEANTCGPPPSACQNIAAQIRAQASSDQQLLNFQGKDRTQTPCADPTPPVYVVACAALQKKCGGGCEGLC